MTLQHGYRSRCHLSLGLVGRRERQVRAVTRACDKRDMECDSDKHIQTSRSGGAGLRGKSVIQISPYVAYVCTHAGAIKRVISGCRTSLNGCAENGERRRRTTFILLRFRFVLLRASVTVDGTDDRRVSVSRVLRDGQMTLLMTR